MEGTGCPMEQSYRGGRVVGNNIRREIICLLSKCDVPVLPSCQLQLELSSEWLAASCEWLAPM